ncbi:Unknown protein, partial [Striga hermonthica]
AELLQPAIGRPLPSAHRPAVLSVQICRRRDITIWKQVSVTGKKGSCDRECRTSPAVDHSIARPSSPPRVAAALTSRVENRSSSSVMSCCRGRRTSVALDGIMTAPNCGFQANRGGRERWDRRSARRHGGRAGRQMDLSSNIYPLYPLNWVQYNILYHHQRHQIPYLVANPNLHKPKEKKKTPFQPLMELNSSPREFKPPLKRIQAPLRENFRLLFVSETKTEGDSIVVTH